MNENVFLNLDGRPAFVLGVNYWSQAGGPRMWERFDPGVVEREIRAMRDMGMNACRAFVFIPSFARRPPGADPEALARFRTFLDLAHRHRLQVFPSLLVGHMSGENYDFPGQAPGQSLYEDEELLRWQVALAEAVCGAVRGHPAVAGWVLSNEMPLWGGRATPEVIRRWAERLVHAVRRADPGRPVGIGDGFMNQHGAQNGYDASVVAEVADWMGPHTYFSDIDPLRHAVQSEVLVRMLQRRGRPVLLEEFGCSSTQASPENQAHYFRESFHGLLSLGGAGALGWCFGDFDLAHDPPYRHHGFELGFGVVDVDGREKPVGREFRALHRLLESIDISTLRFRQARAAIVLPSYFNTDYPFSAEDRRRMRLVVLQSYALALSAGIEADVIGEQEPLAPYDLIIVPSTQKLLEPTWEAIIERVEQGGTAYVSFLYSDNVFHQGMWWSSFSRATGLAHELRYGLPELPEARVTLRLPGGSIRTAAPGGASFAAAYLPVRLERAKVVARDQRGRPALTVNKLGRGRFFFLTYPWEHYLSQQAPSLSGDKSHRIYALLREAAGLPAPVLAGPPAVQARLVERANGSALLWIFNRAFASARTRAKLPRSARRLLPQAGRAASSGMTLLQLAPKEVQVWQL